MTTQEPNPHPAPPSSTRGLWTILSVLLGVLVCLMMAGVALGLVIANRTPVEPTPTPDATLLAAARQTAAAALKTPLPTATATPDQPTALPSPTPSPVTPSPEPTATPADDAAADTPADTPAEDAAANPDDTAADVAIADASGATCAHPNGWEAYQVQPGDTLFAFVLGAVTAGSTVSTDDLRQANCLTSDLLAVGQTLYLPPGAAENAPSSDPLPASAAVSSAPRTPNCDPHCTISIRPGARAEQIAAAVDNVPLGFWGADFLAAVSSGANLPSYDFLSSIPPGNSLEGFLYPGTYELSNATTAVDFRNILLDAFAANLPGDAAASAAAHGLTLYQAITLASIIQRESFAYSEQVLISSVFHNRLRSGTQLGATVTMQYALGSPSNWWPRLTAGQINLDSPYNTNTNTGLPPTPINSPAIDAIRAALSPADTNYLFFTGNCRGSGNVYAASYAEHLANVNCN